MTERERAQDKLLVAIGYALAHESRDPVLATALDVGSEVLDRASLAQHDEDRNGVRRVMGKKDCAEKEGEAKLGIPVKCIAVHSVCDECEYKDACPIPSMVVDEPSEDEQD